MPWVPQEVEYLRDGGGQGFTKKNVTESVFTGGEDPVEGGANGGFDPGWIYQGELSNNDSTFTPTPGANGGGSAYGSLCVLCGGYQRPGSPVAFAAEFIVGEIPDPNSGNNVSYISFAPHAFSFSSNLYNSDGSFFGQNSTPGNGFPDAGRAWHVGDRLGLLLYNGDDTDVAFSMFRNGVLIFSGFRPCTGAGFSFYVSAREGALTVQTVIDQMAFASAYQAFMASNTVGPCRAAGSWTNT